MKNIISCPVDSCGAFLDGLGVLAEVEREIIEAALRPAPGASIPCYDTGAVAALLARECPQGDYMVKTAADEVVRYLRAIEQADVPNPAHGKIARAYAEEAVKNLRRFLLHFA